MFRILPEEFIWPEPEANVPPVGTEEAAWRMDLKEISPMRTAVSK